VAETVTEKLKPIVGTVRVQALLGISARVAGIILCRVDELTIEDIERGLHFNHMLGVALRSIAAEVGEAAEEA
jgi:hypothetical protein